MSMTAATTIALTSRLAACRLMSLLADRWYLDVTVRQHVTGMPAMRIAFPAVRSQMTDLSTFIASATEHKGFLSPV